MPCAYQSDNKKKQLIILYLGLSVIFLHGKKWADPAIPNEFHKEWKLSTITWPYYTIKCPKRLMFQEGYINACISMDAILSILNITWIHTYALDCGPTKQKIKHDILTSIRSPHQSKL